MAYYHTMPAREPLLNQPNLENKGNPFSTKFSIPRIPMALWKMLGVQLLANIVFLALVPMLPAYIGYLSTKMDPQHLCMVLAVPYLWKLNKYLQGVFERVRLRYFDEFLGQPLKSA